MPVISDYPDNSAFDPTSQLLQEVGGAYRTVLPATVADVESGVNPGRLVTAQTLKGYTSFGKEYNYFEETTPQLTFSTGFVDYLGTGTLNLEVGDYICEGMYFYSHNSTNSDFLGRVLYNAVPVYPVVHREEPSDSGGGGFGGTDQRFMAAFSFDFNVPGGSSEVIIQYATSNGGNESALHYANIRIYKR